MGAALPGGDTDPSAGTINEQRFLGRNAELAIVERAVDDARNGVPSVLLVGGDAGIGKSTLVDEGARRSAVGLYLGRCMHLGGDVIPLAPLVDLLRQVRRRAPEAISDSTEFAALAHWLAPGTDGPVVATGSATVFVPALDLLTRLGGDEAVMVGIEDLHWADTVTWDLQSRRRRRHRPTPRCRLSSGVAVSGS